MVLNKKKVKPRMMTEKDIRYKIVKDLVLFVIQYAGVLAIAYMVVWVFDGEVVANFAAIIFCLFMVYKMWIQPLLPER